MNELKSYTEYAVSTPTADFVIGFDFNYGEDAVNVTVDDVPATTAGYTVVYLNETTIRLSPSVPSGVVRLQRETDIDQTDHAYRAGAKFIAQTMDENFEQLRHAQQEVRDGFSKLSTDTNKIIDSLDTALELARDAAQDAQDAAVIAQGAADTVNTIIVGGKVAASNVLDVSTETQQQVNYNGGSKWHSREGGYKLNERTVLTNGDIVKSTINGNTNDPNTDMTGWVFPSKAVYASFDQLPLDAKVGQMAETISYHEGLGYGGATYVYNGGKWELQPNADGRITIEQFGAKCGPKPSTTFNTYPEETTDNTAIINGAYNYAADKGYAGVTCENQNACFFCESMAHIQFLRNVPFDFGDALFFFSLQLRNNPKTAPLVEISNSRREHGNMAVTTNGYLGHAFVFSRTTGDNQAGEFYRLYAYNCRRGMVVQESECINRANFYKCNFTSNYYEGIYVNSFVTTWAHSAPVDFERTIANGNGPQDWILNSNAKFTFRDGTQIEVRDSAKDVAKGQVYIRGISGGNWIRGQISNHGNGRCNSLIMLQNANMMTLDAFDLEDFRAYSLDGTLIDESNFMSYASEASGAAIVADACVSLEVRSVSKFSIGAPAVLKVMNNPGSYNYGVATPLSGFAYTVWDISNPANGFGVNTIHPYALVYGNGVSPIAFANAANKEAVSSIVHHESSNYDYSINWNSLKTLWQNGAIDTSNGYALQYLSNHDQPLNSNHLYNEFLFPTQAESSSPSQYANWIFCELPHSSQADGRFIVQCLDSSNTILSSAWFAPQEGTHYPISNWIRHKVANGTRKIRYGFVNSQNYLGFVIPNYWNNSRYNDWHMTMYLVHDGNGSFRNKIRQSFSACSNEYRNQLIHQATAITNSSAADISGLNAKMNELLAALRTSGAIKS